MTNQELLAYGQAKPGAYLDFPFGEIPVCVKVEGKIFLQLYPLPEDHKVTLKCTPVQADFYRRQYPGIVVRGYHCPPVQQPYWNTVLLDRLPEEELLQMVDQAYRAVLEKLPKKLRQKYTPAAE